MKKSIKRLITVFAVCAVSALACMASGCNVTDKIKEKIEQARCKHEYSEVVVVEESTCSENGKGEKTCAKCGKVETVKLDLADHVAIVVEAVSPTCTKSGKTDSVVCSVCEEVITASQELSPLGHIVVKDKAVEPTCLESGLTEGEHCSRCNEVLKAQEKVPATGHNLVILEAVESTCTTEGKTQGVWCDKCEKIFTEQETVPVQSHNFVEGLCIMCGASDTSEMTEIQANVGDSFAGKIFRIYEGGSLHDNRGPYWFKGTGFSCTWEYQLEGVEIVTYENYIEVFFEEGATITVVPTDASLSPFTNKFDESVIHESSVLEGVYILTTETVSD